MSDELLTLYEELARALGISADAVVSLCAMHGDPAEVAASLASCFADSTVRALLARVAGLEERPARRTHAARLILAKEARPRLGD